MNTYEELSLKELVTIRTYLEIIIQRDYGEGFLEGKEQ